MSSLTNKSIRLAVIPNISMDLRDPRQVHRQKRAQEQKKVEPAMELDVHTDEPEDEYGDPRRDYADSVGMSLHERMR